MDSDDIDGVDGYDVGSDDFDGDGIGNGDGCYGCRDGNDGYSGIYG